MYVHVRMYVEMGGMGCLPCRCPVMGLMQGEMGVSMYWVACLLLGGLFLGIVFGWDHIVAFAC